MAKYTAIGVKYLHENQIQRPNGSWIPARPINYTCDSWIDRVKWAVGVLVGRYDALDWEQ